MAGWVEIDELYDYVGGPFTPADKTFAQRCVDAANACIVEWHPDWQVPSGKSAGAFAPAFNPAFTTASAGASGSAKHRLGALKLAASFYNRRTALGGDYAQFEGGQYMMPGVVDAEISALLDINRHHEPLVA